MYRIENIDKGVWDVTDIETGAVVATSPGRAAARKFVAEQKDGAVAVVESVDSEVIAKTDSEVSVKTDDTAKTLKEVMDRVLDKKAKGEYDKPKRAAKPKGEPKAKAEPKDREFAPSEFSLRKRAKNFDALRDEKGNLPAGLVDAFQPRGGHGIVGLYATLLATFDVSQIGTTYVLRAEQYGDVVEVSDKRDGRLKAASIESWSKGAAKAAKDAAK